MNIIHSQFQLLQSLHDLLEKNRNGRILTMKEAREKQNEFDDMHRDLSSTVTADQIMRHQSNHQ